MITDMVSTGNDVKKDISQVKNKTNWLKKLLINNNNNVFMVPYGIKRIANEYILIISTYITLAFDVIN